MTSKNFLVEGTLYTGRRFQKQRPSAVLSRMDPDMRWCALCIQSISKRQWGLHLASHKHKDNARKEEKLQNFALELWENHRGAPVNDESMIEQRIRDGSIAEVAAKQSERSDAFSTRMLQVERSRAKGLGIIGEDDGRRQLTSSSYMDGDDGARNSSNRNSERAMLIGERHSAEYELRKPRDDDMEVTERNARSQQSQPLINHGALKRSMLLEGVDGGDLPIRKFSPHHGGGSQQHLRRNGRGNNKTLLI